MFLQSFM